MNGEKEASSVTLTLKADSARFLHDWGLSVCAAINDTFLKRLGVIITATKKAAGTKSGSTGNKKKAGQKAPKKSKRR